MAVSPLRVYDHRCPSTLLSMLKHTEGAQKRAHRLQHFCHGRLASGLVAT